MRFARIFGGTLLVVGAFILLSTNSSGQTNAVDTAFQRFWSAESPEAAAKVVSDIAKTGISFSDAYARLQAGRKYGAQKSGIVPGQNRTSDSIEHFYFVNVPANYDPAKKYQVRFQLHGGVGGRTDNKPRGSGDIGMLAGDTEQFYVLPFAWDQAGWWSDDQVLNLKAITDSLKRTYNIDENRVVVAGVSDGATGSYYIAMRETTMFASFLPLNGFIMVLGNDEIDDGRIYPNNLRSKPLFAVNGGMDRLYPIRTVQPYTEHLVKHGVTIEYHPQPDGEHNTKWWPEMKGPFEKFVSEHPRNPHPDQLSWETGDMAHNRSHWLVIDQLGTAAGESTNMSDVNEVDGDEPLYRETDGQLFHHEKPSGRVDLARKGNTVEATTKGVREFTLLLSPDRFDFAQPVRVTANGKVVFNAKVEKSVATLLKWSARDNDRMMLYGAEIQIKLPK